MTYSVFQLLDLPYLPRKMVVAGMEPAMIVKLHPFIENVLPADRSATIDINFKNYKTSIVVSTGNGESSEFEVPFGAYAVMKVWKTFTLRNVTIQMEENSQTLLACEIILLLNMFGFKECKELKVFTEIKDVPSKLDFISVFAEHLRPDKIKLEMSPQRIELALRLSKNLHLSYGSHVFHSEVKMLMRKSESLIIDSSGFTNKSFNQFCLYWINKNCKIQYMKIKERLGDHKGEETSIMDQIQSVNSGNGWIIKKENGKTARVEKIDGYFILTVL